MLGGVPQSVIQLLHKMQKSLGEIQWSMVSNIQTTWFKYFIISVLQNCDYSKNKNLELPPLPFCSEHLEGGRRLDLIWI